jgi:hypothetical protein
MKSKSHFGINLNQGETDPGDKVAFRDNFS